MNARTLFAGLFAVAALGSPAQAAKYKIQWLLAHKNLDYFEEAAADFKKAVESGSRGDISVEIVTAPEQVSAREIAEAVSAGKAQLGHSFTDVVAPLDHHYWVFQAPYLMRGYRHMEGVIEGAPGAALLAGLGSRDLVGLALTYSGGANGVATRRELRRPGDLKGLKVGVYGDEVDKAWLESLGATPVAIEHRLESIVPMSRKGELDAVVTTWRNFERTRLEQSFRSMSLVGSSYLVSVTYANKEFLESLPKGYRDLIVKASRETARIERAKTIELNEAAKRALRAKGVREIRLSEDAQRGFVDALRPAYKASLERLIGRDFLEAVRATPDAPRHPAAPEDFARR